MIYCVVPAALADELYDKLTAYYADDPNVTVIVDRRKGERRTRGADGGGRRELRDRRAAVAAPHRQPQTLRRVTRRAMKLVVHVDGGARGNPGPAAIGVVVSDAGRRRCWTSAASRSARRRTTSPSTARCCSGCERARELGADEVEVVGDSELVAKQVNGQYKVKHAGLQAAARRGAARRSRGFERWRVRTVPRAQNAARRRARQRRARRRRLSRADRALAPSSRFAR